MPRKKSKKKQPKEKFPWYTEDEVWIDMFEWLFCEDDSYADKAVRLFHLLLTELEQPDGVDHLEQALTRARKYAFIHTPFAHECKNLFIESLDKPHPLIAEIMERKPLARKVIRG